MSIMRTKGQGNLVVTKNRLSGKAIITSTPKGGNVFYDLYNMNKKLTIKNYSRDLTYAVFYGWDVISADELEDSYIFQIMRRENKKLRVYITLGRDLQEPFPSSEMFYQCYIHDDAGEWDKTVWLNAKSINYMTFWNMIESVVDAHHSILPF